MRFPWEVGEQGDRGECTDPNKKWIFRVVDWATKSLLFRCFLQDNQVKYFFYQIYLFISIFIYFCMYLPLTTLFIYSLNYFFLNIWYYFIAQFNCFFWIKILCISGFSFLSLRVHVCVCSFLSVCRCICDLFTCLFVYSTVFCL